MNCQFKSFQFYERNEDTTLMVAATAVQLTFLIPQARKQYFLNLSNLSTRMKMYINNSIQLYQL